MNIFFIVSHILYIKTKRISYKKDQKKTKKKKQKNARGETVGPKRRPQTRAVDTSGPTKGPCGGWVTTLVRKLRPGPACRLRLRRLRDCRSEAAEEASVAPFPLPRSTRWTAA